MIKVPPAIARNIIERFIERHNDRSVGVLSEFDRLLLRGILRSICHVDGMDRFLSSQRVLYQDFGGYVNRLSAPMKEHTNAWLDKRDGRCAR
jgi:hypothetical protein